jgi:hypothetical protein
MSMFSNIANPQKPVNNNGSTFINAGATSRSYAQNIQSSSIGSDTIGSIVVSNNNVNKIKEQNNLANNNQKPILKKLGNSISVVNRSKQIRTSLKATSIRLGNYSSYTGKFVSPIENDIYYLCPTNNTSTTFSTQIGATTTKDLANTFLCYQISPFTPDAEDREFSLFFNSNTQRMEQKGLYLRFRLKNDIFADWQTLYVPEELISFVDGNISIDFTNILPDGEYVIEYDLIDEELINE